MLEQLVALGFGCVCATPHVPWSGGRLGTEAVGTQSRALEEAARRDGIEVRVLPAAEHHVSVVMDLLAGDGLVCYPRGDSFLMEFAHGGVPSRVDDLLFRIQVKRMIPVIAHAERYPEVQADPAVVAGWKQRGARILINLSGLAGEWGREAQRAARDLVRRGLVDAASSDLHSPAGVKLVREGLERLEDMLGAEERNRLLAGNPAAIIGVQDTVETGG